MSRNSISENFPNHFQRESLNLINNLVPLSSSGFYLVGPDMRHRGVVFRNLDAAVERDYAENYRDHDPLNPALFAQTEDRVVCIDEQLPEPELLSSLYYREFMQPLKHRHVADMFFRYDGDIISVLTMLREASLGHFSQQELTLLRRLQPFLEYTLNTVYLPKRYRERESIQASFKLTDRELDVVELIVAGASNKIIARELALSLATVKTHIQHIFHKVEVPSRTALSVRVLADLNS
jgi:DNA-binding CsgD family transcriptional regulator